MTQSEREREKERERERKIERKREGSTCFQSGMVLSYIAFACFASFISWPIAPSRNLIWL
jgi:hypothetical protein